MINSNSHITRPQTSAPTAPVKPQSLSSSFTTPVAARTSDSVTLSSEALAGNVDPGRCGNDWRCLEKIWGQLT